MTEAWAAAAVLVLFCGGLLAIGLAISAIVKGGESVSRLSYTRHEDGDEVDLEKQKQKAHALIDSGKPFIVFALEENGVTGHVAAGGDNWRPLLIGTIKSLRGILDNETG